MLIDMIDSGIVRADKYNEFADSGTSMKSSNPLLGNDEEEDDPWAIEWDHSSRWYLILV